jgi:hypothetical protein
LSSDGADYDLGEYRQQQQPEPAYLPRNPVALLPAPFPFQNRRNGGLDVDHGDELPSRLDMRLNKLLDGGGPDLKLPTFGLRRPDIFDLQPQLGFGLADFRPAGMPYNVRPAATENQPHIDTSNTDDAERPAAAGPAAGRGPFPQLTMKQRQFAVSPELPEFYQDHPDFLGKDFTCSDFRGTKKAINPSIKIFKFLCYCQDFGCRRPS